MRFFEPRMYSYPLFPILLTCTKNVFTKFYHLSLLFTDFLTTFTNFYRFLRPFFHFHFLSTTFANFHTTFLLIEIGSKFLTSSLIFILKWIYITSNAKWKSVWLIFLSWYWSINSYSSSKSFFMYILSHPYGLTLTFLRGILF